MVSLASAQKLHTTNPLRARGQSCVTISITIRIKNSSQSLGLDEEGNNQMPRLGTCSRDPIGYEGSELSLYLFVMNNALRFVDFNGMQAMDLSPPVTDQTPCAIRMQPLLPNPAKMPSVAGPMRQFSECLAKKAKKFDFDYFKALAECGKEVMGLSKIGEEQIKYFANVVCCESKRNEAGGADPCGNGTPMGDPIGTPRPCPQWSPSPKPGQPNGPKPQFCQECCEFRGCVDALSTILTNSNPGGAVGKAGNKSPGYIECMAGCASAPGL